MHKRISGLLTIFLLFTSISAYPQSDSTSSSLQMKEYQEYSKQMVSYLESTLNFIGDKDELQSEKDLIINSTYLKIFANDEVQIEDDLDENREIPLNKDIQAYLKDVDFFFKDVEFSFDVKDINQIISDSGEIVFKITINRYLKGITINNDSINNNQLRYIEINLDPYHKDLKIVSIYTTKVKEKDALKNWWNNMEEGWKNYFGKSIIVFDTLPLRSIISFTDSSIVTKQWKPQIYQDTISYTDIKYDSLIVSDNIPIINTDTIDKLIYDTVKANTSILIKVLKNFKNIPKIHISNNLNINNLQPVSELTGLLELDFSNTLISDITPVRNLNKLEVLICKGSAVSNLNPLIYNISLKYIDISNTSVNSAQALANFRMVEKLNISGTAITNIYPIIKMQQLTALKMENTLVTDLKPLNKLTNLRDLDLSNSDIYNIGSIDTIRSLELLNIDSTNIINLEPLSKLPELTVLQANNTPVSNLSPLNNCKNLKVIYCDNSNVTMDEANKLTETNKKCLVIFNSAELIEWWNSLSLKWQEIFKENYRISEPVDKEKLHKLINQRKITISFNKNVQSIKALRMMHRLEDIDLSGTSVFDLEPLSNLNNLENINIKKTNVNDLSDLNSLDNLKYLNIENTDVDDISMLSNASGLEIIYADNTGIDNYKANALHKNIPECLIIFQSEKLRLWWDNLDNAWRNEFMRQNELPTSPSKEQLQTLVNQKKLEILNNKEIYNLNALHIFHNLTTLIINGTSVSDLSQLNSITSLTSLDISNNPVSDIHYLAGLNQLKELIMENTPVEDIEPVSALLNLEVLNISGTKVRTLKYVQTLINLQKLYLNNTSVKKIKYLYKLNNIKELQCYNTSIRNSRIEDYKSKSPNVDVVFY